MSKLSEWFAAKYLQIEAQAIKSIDTANFYSDLFTERQKFYMIATVMALFAMTGAYGAVQFIGFIYIMSKLTPEDENEN
jgi:hypothetical protein